MKRLNLKVILLTVLLVLVLVPLLSACGDDNYVKKDGFTYYDGGDGTYTLVGTKYDKKGENSWPDTIEIPSEVDGNVVDAISGAFQGCYAKKIVLPETITYIGESFIDCYRLETLEIPEATVRIVDGSFRNCPKLVESGDGFDYVGKWAVASNPGAVLATLRPGTIGTADGVSLIGLMVEGEIVVPDDLRYIGKRAFCDQWGKPVDHIKSLTVNEILASEDGFYEGYREDPRTVVDKIVVKTALKGYLLSSAKSIGELIIPAGSLGEGRVAERIVISGGAVEGKTISLGCTELVISASVTSVASHAFSSNVLERIVVEGNTAIAQNAFAKCKMVKEISGPAGILLGMDTGKIQSLTVTEGTVGAALLVGANSLESITILPGVTVEAGALSYCRALTSATVPLSALSSLPKATLKHLALSDGKVLGEGQFDGFAALESITLPAGLLSIGADAFLEAEALADVYFGGTLAEWATVSFANGAANPMAHAENLYVGGELVTEALNLATLSPYAFYGCESLTAVSFLSGLTTIPEGAFSGCVGLTSLAIPASVRQIGKNAFGGCTGLSAVTFSLTTGWYRYESATSTSGSVVYENYLVNPQSAAQYLTDTYENYVWKRPNV